MGLPVSAHPSERCHTAAFAGWALSRHLSPVRGLPCRISRTEDRGAQRSRPSPPAHSSPEVSPPPHRLRPHLTRPSRPPQAGDPIKGEPTKPDKLGPEDQKLIDEATTAGKRTVTVMVIAAAGETAQAKADVRALGGAVRYAADKYSYFSAHVPVKKVDKAAASDSIRAISVDKVVAMPEPGAKPGKPKPPAGPAPKAPDAKTPDNNPYMPTNETGAVAFKDAHPRWDGAGVTIGILDSGVDLSHPALQKTTNGDRKIVDWFTATDPVSEGSLAGEDATWLPMIQDATGPTFPATGLYRGASWKLPAGNYKIRTFDEAGTNVAGCEVCGDVNRDGDTTDRIGVLYDAESHDIRVDSDDNKNFTDNAPMRPYKEKFQVGTFGKDRASTPVVDSMAFTVDYREDQEIVPVFGPGTGLPDKIDFVDIGIVSGEHGSHVAGITAANNMFGGKMDGAAPGAKLVSARACSFGPGCTEAALTDGMAELAANRGVDIINMSIGGLPALNDGNNPRAILYNKIIADGVQLVISAGNSGNALNTVGDPSVATDVVSVGATISDKTWKANYGSDVAFKGKRMMTFSSGGPREDGGFKPNITAPGSAISTIPTWLPGNPVPEAGYPLPAGYAMLNGTSMASPQTAGAMALLLSAAKANGVDAAPAKLRQAVYSTADYNKDVPAFLQGLGQINVTEGVGPAQAEAHPDDVHGDGAGLHRGLEGLRRHVRHRRLQPLCGGRRRSRTGSGQDLPGDHQPGSRHRPRRQVRRVAAGQRRDVLAGSPAR